MPDPNDPNVNNPTLHDESADNPNTNDRSGGQDEPERNAKKDEEGKRVVDPRDHDELNVKQPGGGDESGHS